MSEMVKMSKCASIERGMIVSTIMCVRTYPKTREGAGRTREAERRERRPGAGEQPGKRNTRYGRGPLGT